MKSGEHMKTILLNKHSKDKPNPRGGSSKVKVKLKRRFTKCKNTNSQYEYLQIKEINVIEEEKNYRNKVIHIKR